MNNNFFLPKKRSTRIEYLEMTIFMFSFLIIISLLGPALRPRVFSHTSFNYTVFIIIGSIYLILILTEKIYYSIEINYEKKEIEILYLTLFKNNCKINIPFEKLKFEYKKTLTSSRSGTKKWALKMWNVNKLVFEIKERDNGFEKKKLDEIFEYLSKI